jgi:adenylate cyclase
MNRIGISLDRLVLHLMTLHPDVIGRSIAWAPREPVEVYDSRNGSQLPAGRLRKAMQSGDLLMAAPDNRWEELDIYVGRGLTQLFLAPMMSGDGLLGVLVFGTTNPKGFDPLETELLGRIVPTFRSAVELRMLRHTDLGLLDTFTAAPSAGRILAKRLRHREVETVEGAVVLCTLRQSRPSADLQGHIDGLDWARSVFIKCAKDQSAEIIELSAETLLAVFPSGDHKDVSQRAVLAAMDTSDTIASTSCTFDFAITASYGELSYGSVANGLSTRLAAFGELYDNLASLSEKTDGGRPIVSRRLFDLLGEKGRNAAAEFKVVDVEAPSRPTRAVKVNA